MISLRSLVQRCNINVFWESVNRPFGISSNVSNRHFSIQTLKILLKHPMTQYTIVIAQGQRCSSTELEAYFCYKALSNYFHKSMTLRKGIISINSTIKMYHQFQ